MAETFVSPNTSKSIPAPSAPKEIPQPAAEISPLDGSQIQQLLDAVRRTSGLLAVQHTLFSHLDGPNRLDEPLLQHGLYEFNLFVAETFGEVETKVHALVQEIAKAIGAFDGEAEPSEERV